MSLPNRTSLRSRQTAVRRASLSQAMNQFPRYCEEKKIALVEKSIAAIDEVPRRFAGVETLLLSNNLISDLGQISQFRALKSLSLANNRLEKLTQLLPLRALKELEMVYFDGCPVCLLPTYRDFVIDMLPSLRSLDAKDVYEQERTQARLSLKQLNRMMDLLIVNEEEGTKLEHLQKQLTVHQEMVQKGVVRLYSGTRVASFLAWVPLDWPEELKMQVLDTFENKAKQLLRRNGSKDCLWAYTQNLMEQQQIVARLMILCEQSSKEALNAYITREASVQTMKTSSSKVRLIGADSRLSRSLTIRSESPLMQPMSPAESVSNAEKAPFAVTPQAHLHKNLLLENEVLRKKLHEKEQIVRTSRGEVDEKTQELAKKVDNLTKQCGMYEKERLMMDNKLSIALARNAVLEERVSVLFAQAETGGPTQQVSAQSGFNLVSQEVRNRMLKWAAWKNWKVHHQTAVRLKALQSKARQRLGQETQAEIWRKWGLAHLAAANRPIFEARRAQKSAFDWFKSFKQRQRRQLRLNRILAKVNTRLIATAFTGFEKYPIYRSDRRAKQATAQSIYSSHLFLRAFQGWKGFTQSWTIPAEELITGERKADMQKRTAGLREMWRLWSEWRARFGKKRYLSLLTAKLHYEKHLKHLLLKTLRRRHDTSQDFFLQAIGFYQKQAYECASEWLKALKSAVTLRRVKHHVTSIALKHHQVRLLGAFRCGVQRALKAGKSLSMAKTAYRLVLFRKAYSTLRKITRRSAILRKNESLFHKRISLCRSRAYLMKWSLALLHPTNKAARLEKAWTQTVLKEWNRTVQATRARHYKGSIGRILFVRKTEERAAKLVNKWHFFAANRRKERLKGQKMRTSMKARLVRLHYNSWKTVFSLSLLARAELKLQESQKEQRLSAISRSQSADIDVQNRDLKAKAAEKDKEIAILKAYLSDMHQAEELLKAELQQMQAEFKEVSEVLLATEAENSEKEAKLEKLTANYESQLQVAKAQVDTLRQELGQKAETLQKTYENARKREVDIEERIRSLEEENSKLRTELKSREIGLRHTELLSLSLKAGLDKASRLLAPAVVQAIKPVSARSYSTFQGSGDVQISSAPDRTLVQLQEEQAAIRERLLAKSRTVREGGKLSARRSSSHTDYDTSP